MENKVKDIMESLRAILDFDLIRDNAGDRISMNELVRRVSDTTLDLSEMIEEQQAGLSDKEKLMWLQDISSTIEKSNKGIMKIISELLGITKTLLRNKRQEDYEVDDFRNELQQTMDKIAEDEESASDYDDF